MLTSFYWLLLPQMLAETLWYADWRTARKQGLRGVLWELIRSVLSLNAHALFVKNGWGVSGAQIDQFLRQFGIPTWGWVFIDDGMVFHVRPQQAEYAQYLLVREGVWPE
jgi:hypothetical protein